MRSSTFNFKRNTPKYNLTKYYFATLLITFLSLTIWEIYCRSIGYQPAINDDSDFWVSKRELLENNNRATAIIGASRILFGFELDLYEEAFGRRPIQLSTIGINAGIYLEHLANDPNFGGTVLVGYSPGLFFAGGGPPLQTPKDNINLYESYTFSKKISFLIGKIFDRRLAFLQPDDLKLGKLLENIGVPNRLNTELPPELPPYFYSIDENRQGGLTDRAEQDIDFARYIENIWLGLMAPHEDGLTPEERKKRKIEHVNNTVAKVAANVQKIKEKGGQVIFIRYPSTGPVRDLENELNPRKDYWDRILSESKSQGIHFEDYDYLKDFKCPEGGHISREDRKNFTRLIIPLLRNIYAHSSIGIISNWHEQKISPVLESVTSENHPTN